MALRNRKEIDESKLRGVEIAGEADEVEFGRFTNLQNWIPGQIYSIKKKRGVEAFESDPLTPDPLTSNCGVCPADTVPEAQELGFDECYAYNSGIPPGSLSTNTRGQFNPVPTPAPGVNAIATVGNATGFLGAYPRTGSWQLLRVTDSGMEEVTPVPLPSGDEFEHAIQVGQAGTSGHTDALGYVLVGTYTPNGGSALGSVHCWFDWEAQTVYQMRHNGLAAVLGKWAKHGTDFYRVDNPGGGDEFYYWDMNAAAFSNPTAQLIDTGVTWIDVFRTPNKLWAIDSAGTLYELNPTSLATVTSYATGLTDSIIGFYAASDTLFYILTQGANIAETRISIFQLPSEALTLIDEFHGNGCSVSLNGADSVEHQFHFASGYFYVGKGGTTGSANAGRIGPLLCPGSDDLIIGGDGES